MDDELDLKAREKLLDNEMRAFRNRGFHDGYDDGKKAVVQEAFDAGYQKAFEENFILSTLKGVAQALKTSYNFNNRPTSSTSTTSTSTSSSSTSSPLPPSTSSSNSTTPFPTTSATINTHNISSNHIKILESMKFDNASDIDSIKQDLIKICRENRLDILAHYVSHIG